MRLILSLSILVLVVSCNPSGFKGKYNRIEPGLYNCFDFKDDNTVIVTDIMNLSYSFTYKIFDDKVYIKTDKADLVFDIQDDVLKPSERGNGFYKGMIGVFAKKGSKVFNEALQRDVEQRQKEVTDSMSEFNVEQKRLKKLERIKFDPPVKDNDLYDTTITE
jgi:hypothetical protein